MKLKDLDFAKYDYKRIAIQTSRATEYCVPDSDEYVKKTYGETEITEEQIRAENDWLTFDLQEKK